MYGATDKPDEIEESINVHIANKSPDGNKDRIISGNTRIFPADDKSSFGMVGSNVS
ncbi:hypothetical protein GCM10010217_76620 [Streptomyces tubercidicus]